MEGIYMNYRHAFHAGNFADVMKHALMARLIAYLSKKDKAFRIIDTHSGIGLYDLQGDEASRTGEWQGGVGRLGEAFSAEVEEILFPYRKVLADIAARHGEMVYPGSPAIIREMLRRQDRSILVELHPEDAATLSERYNAVSNIKVLHLDGWVALHALIPPRENRGVVLIDPPFEETNEFERIGMELPKALEKWRSGIYVLWYPIKDQRQVDSWASNFGNALDLPALRLELTVDRPDRNSGMNGCGLIVINPPWTLKAEAEVLLPALAERLGRGDYAAWRCESLGAEP